MISPTVLLDLGNIIFFLATFPQLMQTYVNRHSLKDLSITAFLGFTVATVCFFIAGLMLGATWMTALTFFNICYNCVTMYWIWRSRR